MTVEKNFSFNQMKLQDYLVCERKFELKYILKQAWPAIRSQPVLELEKQMQIGQQFHLFCQQYFSGVPPQDIEAQLNHPQLKIWWQYFSAFSQKYFGIPHFAEYRIAARIFEHPVIAILDLLVADEGGNFLIFDWKTNTKKPLYEPLKNSIQTRLYPFLLTSVNLEINNQLSILPEKIEMIYWFANFPEELIRFPYSSEEFNHDQIFFENLFKEIDKKKENKFVKTSDIFRCKFCQYRSLCERGNTAGFDEDDLQEPWNEEIATFDFDQIGEIEF